MGVSGEKWAGSVGHPMRRGQLTRNGSDGCVLHTLGTESRSSLTVHHLIRYSYGTPDNTLSTSGFERWESFSQLYRI